MNQTRRTTPLVHDGVADIVILRPAPLQMLDPFHDDALAM
jgi:hypothetical protein